MSEERIKELESQLSQHKAHVDVLWNALRSVKPVIQTLAVDRGNGSGAEKLFNSVQEALSQSPATSLAQVEAEAIAGAAEFLRENFNPHNEDEHLAHQRIDGFLIEYANNLKE